MGYLAAPFLLLFLSGSWWDVRNCGVDSNLRGVSVIEDSTSEHVSVWVSGSNGAVVRSTDGGKHWQKLRVPGGESLDFRAVQAFDEKTAYVMSSGEGAQSRIYKTMDGGVTWKLQYQGKQKEFFLDALVCNNEKYCVALSDPVDGKFVLLANEDSEHWRELPGEGMPAALPKEGAFAASNSSLLLDSKEIAFGTGGPAARIFLSHDFGKTWTVVESPILSGSASSGIFSIFREERKIIAVGGDYQDPSRAYKNVAVSMDDGKTWQLATQPPGGYRSAIGRYNGGFVAVGPTGTEISTDGLSWKSIGPLNFNAFSFPFLGGEGWAVGPHGTVARLQDQNQYLI